jgi:hypothetical protein
VRGVSLAARRDCRRCKWTPYPSSSAGRRLGASANTSRKELPVADSACDSLDIRDAALAVPHRVFWQAGVAPRCPARLVRNADKSRHLSIACRRPTGRGCADRGKPRRTQTGERFWLVCYRRAQWAQMCRAGGCAFARTESGRGGSAALFSEGEGPARVSHPGASGAEGHIGEAQRCRSAGRTRSGSAWIRRSCGVRNGRGSPRPGRVPATPTGAWPGSPR